MQWKALFAGDVVFNQLPSRGFLPAEFLQLMGEHAICSCNFEAPVRDKGRPIKKAGPHLDQHPQAPEFLENAGFNVINLANNHMFDYGPEALQETMASFRKAICVGAGINFSEAYALKKFQVNGLTVGLLSFCEAEFGALTLSSSNKAGYAWINHPVVNSLVMESKKEADALIIQVHAGVELADIPLPEWRERYKELIRLGADAIIGSHPHVPQGWEIYNGKPVFYSLGNFYFDPEGSHPLWNTGIVVSLTFNGKQFSGFQVIPVKKAGQNITMKAGEAFHQHLENINRLLEEPVYSETVNKLAHRLWDEYYRSYYDMALQSIHGRVKLNKVIRTFIKRIFFKKHSAINHALLLHNIRIESHRWVVERALEMNNL